MISEAYFNAVFIHSCADLNLLLTIFRIVLSVSILAVKCSNKVIQNIILIIDKEIMKLDKICTRR